MFGFAIEAVEFELERDTLALCEDDSPDLEAGSIGGPRVAVVAFGSDALDAKRDHLGLSVRAASNAGGLASAALRVMAGTRILETIGSDSDWACIRGALGRRHGWTIAAPGFGALPAAGSLGPDPRSAALRGSRTEDAALGIMRAHVDGRSVLPGAFAREGT